MKLLSYRPRSESELRRRLQGQGCPPEVVESTLNKLKRAGFVEDRLAARLLAEDRLLSRPRSRRLLARELQDKGFSPELADRAARGALPELSERELARRALQGKLGLWRGLPAEKRMRRAYSFLLRRGFSPQLAREVVEEALGSSELGRDQDA